MQRFYAPSQKQGMLQHQNMLGIAQQTSESGTLQKGITIATSQSEQMKQNTMVDEMKQKTI